MEYLAIQENYIAQSESLNFSQFGESRIPFNIENNSNQRNIIEEIQKDRRDFLEEVIRELNDLIEQRKNIGERVNDKIEKEVSEFSTKLCEVDIWHKFSNKYIEKLRIEWELQIANLEKEKRIEEISCFRDVSLFKKDSRFFREELRKVIQKEKILSQS